MKADDVPITVILWCGSLPLFDVGKQQVTNSECCLLAISKPQANLFLSIMLSSFRVWLYHILPGYLINDRILRREVNDQKIRFSFCIQIISETFLFIKNSARRHICNFVFMLCFSDLDKQNLFQTFSKSS
jgi:hypothetical protein